MGRHHARIYHENPNAELVAVVDSNTETVARLAKEYHCEGITDYHSLIGTVDAVSIAVPTVMHYEVASKFMDAGVHVLLEKPITATVDEADKLIHLARAKEVILQVGHIERFNAAIRHFHKVANQPVFIEAHRLGPFNPRVRDIGVVMDLMIHDLDIILNLVNSEVVSIDAVGCPVLSDRIDIANVRIRFATGCIANITASRVTPTKKRKIRIFQQGAYFSIDYAKPALEVYKLEPNPDAAPGEPEMTIKRKVERLKKEEPLKAEIDHFIECVHKGVEPQVRGEHAQNALVLAVQITNMIKDDYVSRSPDFYCRG